MTLSEKQISEIHEVLMGDPTRGKLGLFHHHNQMFEDLYGVGPDGKEIEGKKNTVLIRVSKLEDNQRKTWWIVTGICTAFAAIKLGFTALLGKFFDR